MAKIYRSSDTPRAAAIRSTVSPILLFGVEAPPDLGRDGERFPGEHRGLIGDAYADEVAIGIEPGRQLVRKELKEPLPAPRSLDVRADFTRFRHVAHDEVLPARVFGDLARGGLCLLVVVLAVDDGGEPVLRVGVDALPDVEHRSARRVHEDASDRAQPLEVLHGDPEGRKNDDVSGGDPAEVELTFVRPVQELDPHALRSE